MSLSEEHRHCTCPPLTTPIREGTVFHSKGNYSTTFWFIVGPMTEGIWPTIFHNSEGVWLAAPQSHDSVHKLKSYLCIYEGVSE